MHPHRTHALAVLLALLVVGSVPAFALGGGDAVRWRPAGGANTSPGAGSGGATVPGGVAPSVPVVTVDLSVLASVATRRAQVDGDVTQYEGAARRGTQRAITAFERRAGTVPPGHREAVIEGAAAGARALSGGSADSPRPTVSAVEAAAYGAVYGALVGADAGSAAATVVEDAVTGGLFGAAFAAANTAEEGGVVTDIQVLAAAWGAGQGVVGEAGSMSTGLRPAAADYVQPAALGAAAGAVTAAGQLPVYGDAIDARRVHAAAFGGGAGTVRGAAEQRHRYGRLGLEQVLAVAVGTSAGAVSATLHDRSLATAALSNAAAAVARETLGRAEEQSRDQLLESALTGTVDRLLGDLAGDATFPSAIVVPGSSVAIGPPADPDGDGLYEDVNGDRVLTYSDVVSLAMFVYFWYEGELILSAGQRAALDFNGDGVFDERDVRALDEEVLASLGESARVVAATP